MNFTQNCYATDPNFPCKCDYLHLSEPPYEASGKAICGQLKQYTTRTRTLSIKYFYRTNNYNVFELVYTSESNGILKRYPTLFTPFINLIHNVGNSEKIFGFPNQSNVIANEQQIDSIVTLTSPFFPALYPRDYATEHLIQCNAETNATNNECRIRVIFTDFQIALDSTLEVGILYIK